MSAEQTPAVINPSPEEQQAYALYKSILKGEMFEPGTCEDVLADQIRNHPGDRKDEMEIFMVAKIRSEMEALKPLANVDPKRAAAYDQGFGQLLERRMSPLI